MYLEGKGTQKERCVYREMYISLAVIETLKRNIKVAVSFVYSTFP